VKWRFAFKGASGFGAFASTPISLGGIVYLQDLNSNVFALDRTTGRVKWHHMFNKPSVGPNGVALGDGRIYGATATDAFALDARTGKTLWSHKLTRNSHEGVDMTPQVFDGTVLLSTVPGNVSNFYAGNGDGIVWALDAATGQTKWKFNTIADGAKLFGNAKINSGGGLWYPPSVDGQGRVFLSIANPAPLYGTKKFPNGSSRPGPDLYTNSLVALDGQTGKRLWFQQPLPHDVRDYDLMIPAITTMLPVGGVDTEVVLVAGQDGQGVRLPRGRRTAAVDDLRRPPPQRHRAADAQGRDDLPRRLRRGRDADGLRGRPALRAVARPGHPGQRDRPRDLDRRQRGRVQERPRRPDRHRRRNGRGGLAAQAAVDGLRRGHGGQRRRLHQ
jgi:outer membrane protein assembly factor BamB